VRSSVIPTGTVEAVSPTQPSSITPMSSFTISANDVVQGTTVSLIAQGVPTGANGYLGVYYYQDTNNNGVFEAADFPIGASLNVVNGSAQLSLNTTNWSPGTYRFFARALGMNYQFGEAVAQTLTVRAAGLQSLSVSADNVTPGTSVNLLAQCPTALSGSTLGVYYYQDLNNNGAFDSQDFPIGADMNLVGGSAKLTLNTSGWAPGTYRFFARTLDNQYQFGPTSTTTLTIVPANVQNSTPSATSIASGATLARKLDAGAKEDWFQFQAVAGTSYTIRTELVTLRDSMLHLYDCNGKTLLTANDDGDSGLASRINWTAPKSGTYFFKVSAFDKTLTGDFRVSLVANKTHASMISAAGIQTLSAFDRTDSRSGTTMNQMGGSSILQPTSISIGMRGIGDQANNDRSSLNNSASSDTSFNTVAALRLDTSTDRTSGRCENEQSLTLVERHLALRSILGSLFFEEESGIADPAKSIHLDLDTLDALFAQLNEEDLRDK
jgi:hypothetical protein